MNRGSSACHQQRTYANHKLGEQVERDQRIRQLAKVQLQCACNAIDVSEFRRRIVARDVCNKNTNQNTRCWTTTTNKKKKKKKDQEHIAHSFIHRIDNVSIP